MGVESENDADRKSNYTTDNCMEWLPIFLLNRNWQNKYLIVVLFVDPQRSNDIFFAHWCCSIFNTYQIIMQKITVCLIEILYKPEQTVIHQKILASNAYGRTWNQ